MSLPIALKGHHRYKLHRAEGTVKIQRRKHPATLQEASSVFTSRSFTNNEHNGKQKQCHQFFMPQLLIFVFLDEKRQINLIPIGH